LLLADRVDVAVCRVELRHHHAGRIMRWTPQIIGKDNGAVAQIVRNNIVAADIVRKY